MTAIARFLANVPLGGSLDDCQEWGGTRKPNGYGSFWDGKRKVSAHRWILGHMRGRPLGPGEEGLHSCDNPPCVNLRHLRVGDKGGNMRDAYDRGRRERYPTAALAARGPARCGTPSGYKKHRRLREPACPPCLAANAAAVRAAP